MKKGITLLIALCCLALSTAWPDLTIAEKKASLEFGETDLDPVSQQKLKEANAKLGLQHQELQALCAQVGELFEAGAPESSFQALATDIKELRTEIAKAEKEWKLTALKSARADPYSLWHQPETTIGQLVNDYGSWDYVYVIPPDIASLRLCVDSHIAIPRENWNELLEHILAERGIGIHQVNPYLRQLYFLKQDTTGLFAILCERAALAQMPPAAKICYILQTKSPDPTRAYNALLRFVQSDRLQLHSIGKALFLFGSSLDIQELLKLHDFISQETDDQEYKMVPLTKIEGKEMETILKACFNKVSERDNAPPHELSSVLQVMSFSDNPYALFLLGTKEQLTRAQEIVQEVQDQLKAPQERVVFWYACKNSEAEELAKVLEKVYLLMTNAPVLAPSGNEGTNIHLNEKTVIEQDNSGPCFQPNVPNLIVNPPPFDAKADSRRKEGFGNFIVDTKSNAIVMVVEQIFLPRLKELLQKLDCPKKMVQLEVLLVEKRTTDKNNFGLNLLRMGAQATGTHSNALTWDFDPFTQTMNNFGILNFLLSRKAHGHSPNFDLAYNFLLSQDDMHVNASPSVITVNQTPAKIAVLEEISINTGVFQCNTQNPILENAYTRAQYGIVIEITPTVHLPDEDLCEDSIGYVTLNTEVEFDTIKPSRNERPDVIRRNIKNQVRIADGQTVILGGLRRKTSQDSSEKIPFLGEIPGFGKLFSNSTMHDHHTEMFIFITPKIIYDPEEDLDRLRRQELCRRPGDIPEFLLCLVEAQKMEKRRAFSGSMKLLFGRPNETPNTYGPCDD